MILDNQNYILELRREFSELIVNPNIHLDEKQIWFWIPYCLHLRNHESRLLNWMKLYFKEDFLKLCLFFIQWLRFVGCCNV